MKIVYEIITRTSSLGYILASNICVFAHYHRDFGRRLSGIKVREGFLSIFIHCLFSTIELANSP